MSAHSWNECRRIIAPLIDHWLERTAAFRRFDSFYRPFFANDMALLPEVKWSMYSFEDCQFSGDAYLK